MMADVEQQRHAEERGEILRILKEDFGRLVSTRTLFRAMDLRGRSVSWDGLEFHLRYLGAQGYVRLKRVRDMPGFRSDRPLSSGQKADTIMFATLEPQGLHLLDGVIKADPSVSF